MAPRIHPFDSVKDYEIKLASKLIKDSYPADANCHFVQIERTDPPKKDMIKYLDAERQGLPLPNIPRVLYAYYWTNTLEFNKALVNVTVGHIITKVQLPKGVCGPLLPEDMEDWEEHCNNHPAVKAEIEKLQLPPGYQVRNDPWIYATDDPNEKRPLVQFFMYVLAGNGHSESNHYSLPLKFSPVFECFTKKFIRIDYLPGGYDEKITPTGPWQEVPAVEYHPDLNGENVMREVKPLLVNQPEGPSYTVQGSKIKWQGWEFRVSSSAREGFAIYDAWFKGRQVFYRVSLSEMTVPYGDPRAPYHRKQAFDLGDCGFGACGNSLSLGCDCLGTITYLDGMGIHANGDPFVVPNTICLHEQDNGLLYKHVNYRNGNAVLARKREFVVQTIATVANYEYIINFKFVTDGSLDIETRATGILSTMPIDENVKVPWGTIVGPNVMAAYHQHILSFRIDPAVDGHKNTVVYDDTLKLPRNKLNPYGIGFVTDRHFVEKAGSIDQSPFTNRTVKILNENVINPVSKGPVGYKVSLPAAQMILADDDSFNVKRAKFATEQMWVTKYRDHELFAAGEFTNQSQTDEGLGVWGSNGDLVRNEDLVVWATLGFTHIPRVEDFPVMPVETHTIHLAPFNFFDKNPALDLPQANNNFNKSVNHPIGSDAEPPCCSSKI
ncbi:copper-containing amine oxidase [Suhomyces tanzawaensis NRRL Y-17324]|uniref:Amine oxidase n=1 Tax=Suhomyces tanzawaensis NRRL Y-17324 TaxID=984487 RepID=A0A1E4SMB9_9ASCO|nr:copper-containing amine oxidase [Suhomyces tanzawaensis NRRL Y-17324]ODV80660.1 copper-containing amine oxidase [Suhomyces tanzawaensis NRRL Y-17324]